MREMMLHVDAQGGSIPDTFFRVETRFLHERCERKITDITIMNCSMDSFPPVSQFENIDLRSLRTLKIMNCPNLTTLPFFPRLDRLVIVQCMNLVYLPSYPELVYFE